MSTRSRSAVVSSLLLALVAAAAPGAAASRGISIVRKNGPNKEQVTLARQGYLHRQLDARGRTTGGIIIDYRSLKVTVFDSAAKRFQRVDLAAAVARVKAERAMLRQLDTPYFELPDRLALPKEKVRRLSLKR